MRKHTMSEAEALRSILPTKRSDRRTLLKIGGFLLFLAVCGAGLYYNNYRNRASRVQEWSSAVATIEDARPKLAMRVDGPRGGVMLYEVEILAKYSIGGVGREKWTRVGQLPQPLADAQLQIYLWKGKQCSVRWNPADPEQIIAEIN